MQSPLQKLRGERVNISSLILFLSSAATCEAAAIQGVANGKYQVEAGNDITRESVDFDTVVKFVCDAGYELKGSLRSHCTNQGWSNPKPECISKLY